MFLFDSTLALFPYGARAGIPPKLLPPFALSPLHERLSFEVWYIVLLSILSSSLLSV